MIDTKDLIYVVGERPEVEMDIFLFPQNITRNDPEILSWSSSLDDQPFHEEQEL